jgi:hypothetical protein
MALAAVSIVYINTVHHARKTQVNLPPVSIPLIAAFEAKLSAAFKASFPTSTGPLARGRTVEKVRTLRMKDVLSILNVN